MKALSNSWVISDEEMEELQKYIDSLQAGDADHTGQGEFDFEYFF